VKRKNHLPFQNFQSQNDLKLFELLQYLETQCLHPVVRGNPKKKVSTAQIFADIEIRVQNEKEVMKAIESVAQERNLSPVSVRGRYYR